MTQPETLFEPRNARTTEDGLRFYTWKGNEYPSVTTIRRMAGVPFPLQQWTVTQVVNRAVDHLSDLNRMVTSDDPQVAATAKTWLRRAATEERDRASKIGKRIHDAAQNNTPAGMVPIDIRPSVMQLENWYETTGFDVRYRELQVFNLTKGFAGSFDLMGYDRDRNATIVDLKSGKSTYPEHALQTVGYALGEFVGADDVVNDEATAMLSSVSRITLLHLRPEGWVWMDLVIDKPLITAFNGLLTYAVWADQHKKVESLVSSEQTGAWLPTPLAAVK